MECADAPLAVRGLCVTVVYMSDIERFVQEVEKDPMFAADGMDVERAERNLAHVVDELCKLEADFSKRSPLRRLFLWRYPLARYAVPVSFVSALIKSERARRAFLSCPTPKQARLLLSAWERTAQNYARDVERYRAFHDVLRAMETEEDSFQFQDMFGNVSDIEYIEGTLQQLNDNAGALRRDVEQLRRVFSGAESRREFPGERTIPAYETGTLSPTLAHFNEIRVRERMPYNQSDIIRSSGPVRYTLAHFDGVPTEHLFILYVLRDKQSGIEHFNVTLADRKSVV